MGTSAVGHINPFQELLPLIRRYFWEGGGVVYRKYLWADLIAASRALKSYRCLRLGRQQILKNRFKTESARRVWVTTDINSPTSLAYECRAKIDGDINHTVIRKPFLTRVRAILFHYVERALSHIKSSLADFICTTFSGIVKLIQTSSFSDLGVVVHLCIQWRILLPPPPPRLSFDTIISRRVCI